MSEKQTVTVNGRHYDAHSGLAIDLTQVQKPQGSAAAPAPAKRAVAAANVHSTTQRSHTLNRKLTKRPGAPTPATPKAHEIIKRSASRAHQPLHTAKSQHITKFAPHPSAPKPVTGTRVMDIGPATHPHVAKAHAISKAKAEPPLPPKAPERPSAQHIKQAAISAAVSQTTKHVDSPARPSILKRHPRRMSIVTASIALVLLGGYLTYINMPSLSVRVAAAQAGIDASYPSYQPDGYSLSGMIGYAQGKVSMKFASNGGPHSFTINETKSGWDSAAVLDNYVTPRAGASYIPYTEHGLTIYTYGNNAAWVNGGILYTIEGDAPLSSEQIRHIATSLI